MGCSASDDAPPQASTPIALDDSPRAHAVFEAGTVLAQLTGAQVFLVRVLTEPTDIPPAARTTPDRLERDVEQAVRDEFQSLMNTAPDIQFAAPLATEGDRWRRIIGWSANARQTDARGKSGSA